MTKPTSDAVRYLLMRQYGWTAQDLDKMSESDLTFVLSSMERPHPATTPANVVFLDFIEKELHAERNRKVLIRRDATTLTIFSGVVAALLAALGIVGMTHTPRWAVVPLTCAVVTYVISATLGLLAARSTPSSVASVDSLDRMRDEHWEADVAAARKAVAHVHTLTITALRNGNNARTRLLDIGQLVQLAAVIGTLPAVILWTWPR